MDIEKRIRRMLEARLTAIAQAAAKGSLSEVSLFTNEATELETLLKAAVEITSRLDQLDQQNAVLVGVSEQETSGTKHKAMRTLPIQVTEGMIRQNLLTFTRHVKQKRIKIGEVLFIEAFPSGDRFKTELLQNGNKLRERGAVARFYRDASVQPGDFVEMIESSPQQWTLRKAEAGKYIGKQGWTAEEIQNLLK